MVRSLALLVAMLIAADAHAGLYVFGGRDQALFQVSFRQLEHIVRNGGVVARLSLRIDGVTKRLKSATVRCEARSTSGEVRLFLGELLNLKIDEHRDIILEGKLVVSSVKEKVNSVRCDIAEHQVAG